VFSREISFIGTFIFSSFEISFFRYSPDKSVAVRCRFHFATLEPLHFCLACQRGKEQGKTGVENTINP
jgi:hypothetical protein